MIADLILAKVTPEPNSGCWLWTGARAGGTGYGVFGHQARGQKNKAYSVHRTIFEHFNGPIPSKLVIDHKCRNRLCCNPDHLEVVTQSVNVLRGDLKKVLSARAQSRQACKHGHPWTEKNTGRATKDGSRVCRECCRLAMRWYRAEKKKLTQSGRG